METEIPGKADMMERTEMADTTEEIPDIGILEGVKEVSIDSKCQLIQCYS